jgi:hypothetical protein
VSVVKFDVTLEEKLTGKTANNSKTIFVSESDELKIELIRSQQKFKPGFPYLLRATLRKFDGTLESNTVDKVKLIANFIFEQPSRAERLSQERQKNLTRFFSHEKALTNGYADFEIQVPLNVRKIDIAAQYKSSKSLLKLEKHSSTNDEYLIAKIIKGT